MDRLSALCTFKRIKVAQNCYSWKRFFTRNLRVLAKVPPSRNALFWETLLARLLQEGDPEKMLLFGSHARGDAHSESDVDLLIVEDTCVSPRERAVDYALALRGMGFAKDILVRTPEELAYWRGAPNHLLTEIQRVLL